MSDGQETTAWDAVFDRLQGRLGPPPLALAAQRTRFADVRLETDTASAASAELLQTLTTPRQGGLHMLALSGGGAGGAFGAGVLVGLSQAGVRPRFDVVTGVSTGALIAPLAFAGPEWDGRLRDAYTGSYAADLLGLRSLRPIVQPGLFAAEGLKALVARFVDQALLEAVAERHRAGARLLIATTNLDAERPVIWDMGRIAISEDEGARDLFIDVLAASASLPGVFPPRLIEVATDQGLFDELHVDGGTATPLFVAPDFIALPADWVKACGGVHVRAILNASLTPVPAATRFSALSVLVRSFDVLRRSSYAAALKVAAALCASHGADFAYTVPPDSVSGENWLRFDQATLRRIFDQGLTAALSSEVWKSA